MLYLISANPPIPLSKGGITAVRGLVLFPFIKDLVRRGGGLGDSEISAYYLSSSTKYMSIGPLFLASIRPRGVHSKVPLMSS